MNTKREQILFALSTWVAQRPGLEFGNYGDVTSYRSEMRRITAQRHDFDTLLAAVSWRKSIDADALRAAFRDAYSGRLTLHEDSECAHGPGAVSTCGGCRRSWCDACDPCPSAMCPWCNGAGGSKAERTGRVRLKYCTGQYWPTEYRAAACAVLASALWAYWRDCCPDDEAARRGLSPGSWVRCTARRELGAPLARRWFDWDDRSAADWRAFSRAAA